MPGTLGLLRESMAEGGPRIKCYEGSVTLVSPGETHETTGQRLIILILAICGVLRIPHSPLGSTYYSLPKGSKDSGYEPDQSYYIQSHGTAGRDRSPTSRSRSSSLTPRRRHSRAVSCWGSPRYGSWTSLVIG